MLLRNPIQYLICLFSQICRLKLWYSSSIFLKCVNTCMHVEIPDLYLFRASLHSPTGQHSGSTYQWKVNRNKNAKWNLTGEVYLTAVNSLKQSQDMSFFMCSRFAVFTLHTMWCIGYEALDINPLNANLNPIFHLLALLGAHPVLHVSRIRINRFTENTHPVFVFWLTIYKSRQPGFPFCPIYGLKYWLSGWEVHSC